MGLMTGSNIPRQTLLIFTNIKYITVSDEFNVLTGYTVLFHMRCILQCVRVLYSALNVCTLATLTPSLSHARALALC